MSLIDRLLGKRQPVHLSTWESCPCAERHVWEQAYSASDPFDRMCVDKDTVPPGHRAAHFHVRCVHCGARQIWVELWPEEKWGNK